LGKVGRGGYLPDQVALKLLQTIHRFTAASGPRRRRPGARG
jgi:hypothetical protein